MPDGSKTQAAGAFWTTAVAAMGDDVIDKNSEPLYFLDSGGNDATLVFGSEAALHCCDT